MSLDRRQFLKAALSATAVSALPGVVGICREST